ncbi:hypothetical protein HYDPIDRAFT_110283 [Hydnomerulius pinastri MD-312]|nr:hypothetical protein HYDPIDRAFT_110283 [Hydnomerulius pinastri MD-312]
MLISFTGSQSQRKTYQQRLAEILATFEERLIDFIPQLLTTDHVHDRTLRLWTQFVAESEDPEIKNLSKI